MVPEIKSDQIPDEIFKISGPKTPYNFMMFRYLFAKMFEFIVSLRPMLGMRTFFQTQRQ